MKTDKRYEMVSTVGFDTKKLIDSHRYLVQLPGENDELLSGSSIKRNIHRIQYIFMPVEDVNIPDIWVSFLERFGVQKNGEEFKFNKQATIQQVFDFFRPIINNDKLTITINEDTALEMEGVINCVSHINLSRPLSKEGELLLIKMVQSAFKTK